MPEPDILRDLLVFLLAPVVVVPLFRRLRVSPILGYLAAGALIGPEALGLIAESPTTHVLAELGVAFLLFAIGLELSLERLRVMRRLVFGLGGAQVLRHRRADRRARVDLGPRRCRPRSSSAAGSRCRRPPSCCSCSSSAASRSRVSGRAAFAILLFQDLAVVPLLVLVPVFALDPASIAARARRSRCSRRRWRSASILLAGRFVLRPVLHAVAERPQPGAVRLGDPARGARHRLADHPGRPVDAARRLPRRPAPRRERVPPPGRGRHPALPRPAARVLLHDRRPVAGPRAGGRTAGACCLRAGGAPPARQGAPDRRALPRSSGCRLPTRSASGCCSRKAASSPSSCSRRRSATDC